MITQKKAENRFYQVDSKIEGEVEPKNSHDNQVMAIQRCYLWKKE